MNFEASITLISKTAQKKRNMSLRFSLTLDVKVLNKILANRTQQCAFFLSNTPQSSRI